MTLGITGGTGFIGQALQKAAHHSGQKTLLFSRHPASLPNARLFNTRTPPNLQECDAIVHLAGESILGLWTSEKRRKILESRREGTRRLVEAIAQAPIKPSVFISSSAIAYYGDTGDCLLDELSPAGKGFLTEVTQIWEEEAMKAERYGVRVILLRTGLVLSHDEGMMKLITPLFRYGLGGQLGSGRQWMSCIHINDLVAFILHCCKDVSIHGPVNAVMPHPIRNHDFTTP